MSGLRERKKQATREALSMAALRLAIAHGIENVLVEDIAAAVDVSPRTFNNYFSSKYEAIWWRELNRAMVIGDLLRARPADEPLWDGITHAVLQVFGGDATAAPPAGWIDGIKRMMSTPQMLGEVLKGQVAVQDELATAIADRLGLDPSRDMYPRVIAGAVMAAYQTARDYWLEIEPPVPMGPLILEALAQLKNLQGGTP
ncbi:TetR/AcrR family transcriptional regulator [Actinocrispum wychmicini]|uniref:TetR/AcrR family transcriptional regulator n=1 Tax=Actinocrispum wychmicini TaxID=1213861 RepID=UPI001FB78EAD|nr:TetR family transcriptional regulator [Actinocrispum wychmicini]